MSFVLSGCSKSAEQVDFIIYGTFLTIFEGPSAKWSFFGMARSFISRQFYYQSCLHMYLYRSPEMSSWWPYTMDINLNLANILVTYIFRFVQIDLYFHRYELFSINAIIYIWWGIKWYFIYFWAGQKNLSSCNPAKLSSFCRCRINEFMFGWLKFCSWRCSQTFTLTNECKRSIVTGKVITRCV